MNLSRIYKLIHTTVGSTPLDEWSAFRRDLLPDNTQHAQQRKFHAPVGFEPTISAGERPQTNALDRVATGTSMGFVVVPNKLILILISRSCGWSYFTFSASCCNQPPLYRTYTKLLASCSRNCPLFFLDHRIERVCLWSLCWTMPFSFRIPFRKCWSFRLNLGLSSGPFSWSCSGISYEFVSSCIVLNTELLV